MSSDDPREPARTSKITKRQFWRESEQRWVDAVLMRRDDALDHYKNGARWRHYTITTTVEVSEFLPGDGR